MRRVTCRFDGCNEVYPLRFQEGSEIHTHVIHIFVEWRLTYISEFIAHEREECALRDKREEILSIAEELNALKECPRCRLSIRSRDFGNLHGLIHICIQTYVYEYAYIHVLPVNHTEMHQEKHCLFRKVMCKYKDCAEPFLARDEEDHYKYECCSKYITTRSGP